MRIGFLVINIHKLSDDVRQVCADKELQVEIRVGYFSFLERRKR